MQYDDSNQYDYYGKLVPAKKTTAPEWLVKLLGPDFFHAVVAIDFRGSQKKLTDADLVFLKGLPGLRKLELRWSPITDVGLENLKELLNLQAFSVGGAVGRTNDPDELEVYDITDKTLKNLEGLTQLQSIQLGKTRITDAGLANLKNLTQLCILDINDTAISDAGLKHLHGLSQLHDINLWNTKVTDDGLDDLLRALPELDIQEPNGLSRNHSPTRIRPP